MFLTANGLGRFTIGMPWSVAVSAGLHVVSEDADCRLGVDNDTNATVVAVGDEVVRISVQTPGVLTQRGAEVGDKREDATYWYRDTPNWTDNPLVRTEGDNEIVIGFHDNVVTYIWAQRSGTVIGC